MVTTVTQETLEERREARWEAGPAIVLVIVLQSVLAITSQREDWTLWVLPWWTWLLAIVPEVVLLVCLAWSRPRAALERMGHGHRFELALLAVVSFANACALAMLIGSLLVGSGQSGGELLLKALVIWTTNVIVFGLWFWALDRGGPVSRGGPDPPPPDFLFPQMDPDVHQPEWRPHLEDYIYTSFTNSIAFSPTDTMPLTRAAKRLMLLGSAVSALTVLLVAARAVNILR